ncbi:beta-lactamase family protein [Pelagibacterium sp. 26DY04]|uniref:serine hydrolase domain-containing protein n=1 Tax=Pelagibacterium sp. 26DY04 TaxID=2967130 RepID=UPI0028159F47|nr:serine hydrolase [Pelagibacterium sp. 26DY04]WMT88905.1 beta-lactamase family protein [Pelagibacterium sp. 26DY04]
MSLETVLDRGFAPLAEVVAAGRIPGGVLGVVDAAGARAVRAVGKAQTVPIERAMTAQTWFDLASLTKVLFTTPRILALAEEGKIDLDAPLTTAIPDFAQYNPDNWQRKVTFRQCLGHQTPFPGVFPLYTYGTDPNLLRHFVLQHAWSAGPAVYSDINFILLGIALERLGGKGIREMDPGPGFAWSADPSLAAATETDPWRGRVLVGEVHDENCAALAGAGHAGLFGTVSAVLDFAQRVLSEETEAVRLMRTPLSGRRTHGWERPYEGWSGGEHCSPETIGHTGFTGTGLWIDFSRGRAWTLLTNRVHPSRHFDSGIFVLRRAVGDAINRAEG